MKHWLLGWLLLSGPLAADLLQDERQRLLEGGALQPEGITLEVPAWVEDGAFVPVTVRLAGAEAPVELALLRPAEADPRIARITAHRWQAPLEFSTRVRLLESQPVEVIARDALGRVWQASQTVRIAASSCLSPASSDPLANLGETRAWQREQGGAVELVSLLRHPMETGRRKNAQGELLPRRLLQRIRVEAGGELLMQVTPYEGLAANPYWRLLLPETPTTVTLTWIDQDGSRYRHESQPGQP